MIQPLSQARPAAQPAVIWTAAALLAILLGAAFAVSPLAALALLALGAAAAAAYAAFTQPRWILVAEIVVLVSYSVDLLRERTAVPLTTESLVVLLVLGLGFRQLLRLERVELPSRETGLVLALLLALGLSLFFAEDRAVGTERIAEFVKNALLLLLMLVLVDRVVWLRRACWAFAGTVGILAVLAAVGRVTGLDFAGFAEVRSDRGLLRAAGPLDPNFFGQILVVGGALSLYLYLADRRSIQGRTALALSAVSLAAVGLTFSRGAFVAVAAVLLAVAVLRRVPAWIPIGAAAVAIVLGAILLPQEHKTYLGELATTATSGPAAAGDLSLRERFGENLVALEMFRDAPLVGVGPGNYPVRYLDYSQEFGFDRSADAKAPHSLYLEALAETGALGTAVLLLLVGLAVSGAWRAREAFRGGDRLLAEGILVALIGFLVSSLFLHASAFPRYLWMAVGLGLAAGRLAERPRV